MKNLILLILTFISISAHAKLMDYSGFLKLNDHQKVEILVAYKKFLADQPMPLGDSKKVSLMFSFINEAVAAAGDDCFYAGWPSKVRAAGGRQFCTSPANGTNPDYAAQASQCSGSQMLCNPVLFGDVGCITAATQTQKNMAFASCEKKFKSSGKSISEVAALLSDPAKRTSAEAMFATAEKVCSPGGFQAAKPMCRNLSAKVAAVKGSMPAVAAAADASQAPGAADEDDAAPDAGQSDPALVSAARVAADSLARVHQLGAGETCDETSHDHSRPAAQTTDAIARVYCDKPSLAGIPETLDELLAELRANDVVVTKNPFPEANIPDLRNFIAEMRKFPTPLMRELKAKGAKVRLIVGEGVGEDEGFTGRDDSPEQLQKQRESASLPPELRENWRWTRTPGSGGAVSNGHIPMPTRIVINHLYDRHGSSNLFLHEHGHTLDTYNGHHSVSESYQFKAVLNGADKAKIVKLMNAINPPRSDGDASNGTERSYMDQFPGEGFAELFSYYHACEKTQKQIEEVAPSLANFFRNFTSLEDFFRREQSARIVYVYR